MIYLKEKRTYYRKPQRLVRFLGHTFWISESEFVSEVAKGNVFYKANKPVSLNKKRAPKVLFLLFF